MLSRIRNLPSIASAMKLDSAVVKLLSLDPANTSVSSHGGAGMSSASTSKITTKLDNGSEKQYFMKTGTGKEAEIMFAGQILCQHRLPPYLQLIHRQANTNPSTQSTTPYQPSVPDPTVTAHSQTNPRNTSSQPNSWISPPAPPPRHPTALRP